jgi:phosphoribosylcarboxyaminoimidazole (NCAIR) mutase
MGINSTVKVPRIEVIVGSESDLCQTGTDMVSISGISDTHLSIISCHRNPDELRKFLKEKASKADVFIAGAGMAAALPGIVKAELCALGHVQIPVIGVAFKGKTEQDDQAAKLSIECLPGQPVELDPDGRAYFGPEGFLKACKSAVNDEFLPKTRSNKPAQIHINAIS